MFQIDNTTVAAAIPGPTPAGIPGYFTDGNPATGVPATILPAEFMNMLMMENINVLVAGGITPAKGQYNQLALAIAQIVQNGAAGQASETVSGVLKLSTVVQVIAGTNDSVAVTPLKLATAVRSQALTAVSTAGASPSFTLTPSPAITAYAAGQRFRVKFHAAGAGSDTLNWSTLGPKNLKQYDPTGAKIAAIITQNLLTDVEYDGTDMVVLNPLPISAPVQGQCRLAKSGANLVLSPLNGNKLIISGVMQVIPSAGVSLAATGLTPSTLYYIYAYMNAGVMTLEASATGHSADAITGVEIKTGDSTRTLVGMVRPITGPAFIDSSVQRFVLSWFNQVGKDVFAKQVGTASTTSGLNTVLTSTLTCEFLTWGSEAVLCSAEGSIRASNNNATVTMNLTFDGSLSGDNDGLTAQPTTANFEVPCALTLYKTGLAEGYHSATLLGNVTGGFTATWGSVAPWFNRVLIRG